MNQITVADYIDWAVEKLVEGSDSPDLRLLSGLDATSSLFEAELHFAKAIKQLGILEPDRAGKLRAYGVLLARLILDGVISPRAGVYTLYRICVLLDYPKEFMVWLELDDAYEDIKAGLHPYSYQSTTAENCESIVRLEAEKFLELAKNNFLPPKNR